LKKLAADFPIATPLSEVLQKIAPATSRSGDALQTICPASLFHTATLAFFSSTDQNRLISAQHKSNTYILA
jgi:hypothetical protein